MTEQKKQPKPTNEIDLQAMTTMPHISSEYMSENIKAKFRDYAYVTDEKGNILKDEDGNPRIQLTRDLWSVMELFTQDFRLGNLNKTEAVFVRYHIDLCSDILTVLPSKFNQSALIMLERAFSVTETSQSKGGFLRRLFNSIFQHSNVREEQPQKRNFFGMGKKQQKTE